MTNTAQWECPHCGQRYPTQHEALEAHAPHSRRQDVGAPPDRESDLGVRELDGAPPGRRATGAPRLYPFCRGAGGARAARQTAQEDAAEINRTLPRLQARAEGEDVTLKCGCGNVFFFKHDNPAWEQCDECLDAAPRP